MIAEKIDEPDTRITSVSCKASIQNPDLYIFIAVGWVKANYVAEKTKTKVV